MLCLRHWRLNNMSLLSKLNSNTKAKAIEPREIFMTLPFKPPGYGYPRDVQSEVWKKWYEIRNEKNVILKMNTGSGKTVVGLMILQSSLNEGKGPAIYAVPDAFLVKQVLDEAKRFGIQATENKDDYGYSNSKSILVTTIQSIVNGRSAFGMREYGNNYPIGSIIIDDVHACMDKINNQYMIRLEAGTDVYDGLISIFAEYLKDYNPRSYIDVVEMGDCRKTLLVPYWEWQKRQDEVYRLLSGYNNNQYTGIFFGLPLIEGCLETCDCIITAKAIEISPKGIDIAKIESLSGASRRVFMSATLSDDSVFISSLGLDKQDMKNIITPENANDIGDRLILFPKHINNDISDTDIKTKVEETASKYNVVILVPSFNRAKFWDSEEKCTVKKENIDKVIDCLKSGKRLGKVVIVNRYDGIDLPGEACRMLVIDGLPPLNSIKDRYIQSIAPQSTTLLREQVQRIEQGMGRGVRSNDDECCIVLMGDELSDVLSRNRGVDFFSAATKSQYNLSKELWDLLVEEMKEKPSLDQIFELAKYSLEKDPEWVTMCKERLSTIKYSSEAKVDNKIVALRKAFESSIKNQWNDASNYIKHVKDIEEDKKTKGFLCQILAEYTNKYDPIQSQQILVAGKKLSGAILSPIEGIQYQKTINDIPQAMAIKNFVDGEKLDPNEMMIFIDSILSKLNMGEEYEKFEDGLDTVGKALGFVCSRPDKETGGYGPDNLWALDACSYFIIECKTEANTNTIKKDYCNQIAGSVNWFYENYSSQYNCKPIMIHPSNVIDKVASPDENMVVITERELSLFRRSVHDFYRALCHNGNMTDVEKINELLRLYKLSKNDIINDYTVKFVRQS